MARIMVNGSTTVSLPQGADVESSVNLNALNDVTLTNPQQDQLLTYSGGQWVNQSWADLGTGTTISPDALRMKQYELPDWVQFGNYNLDDSVPLSVNANSIAHSSWRRSTSSTGRTVAMNGLFYDFQNTSPSAWENIGPGFAWGIADQYSVYYAGNVDVRTEPGSITTDLTGNMDTFQTRMDWRVYEKFSGSPNVTGYNIMTLRKDSATFDGSVDVTNDLIADGKLSMKAYSIPSSPQYGGANIGDVTDVAIIRNTPAFLSMRRFTGTTTGFVNITGAFYDKTDTNPANWTSCGSYSPFVIADQQATFTHAAIKTNFDEVTTDGSGNLDSFVGKLVVETWDKRPGTNQSSGVDRFEPLRVSSGGTSFNVKDRITGTPYDFSYYAEDGIFRLTSSAGAFRFQQSVEAAQNFEVQGTSMIVQASQVDFTNLPTSDPLVAGRLWNDAGTMKISAG